MNTTPVLLGNTFMRMAHPGLGYSHRSVIQYVLNRRNELHSVYFALHSA